MPEIPFNTPDISLVLPAYNEAKSIANTVSEVRDYFKSRGLRYEIIVAADGNDGTREIVSKMSEADPNIKVLGQVQRLGKGRGIRSAVAVARGAIIGFADADNKVPIDEFDKIREYLNQGFDLVFGSRALDRSRVERKQPLYRQLGSRGFAFFMHAVIGLQGIRDTQCGFKFFRHQTAKDLFRRQSIDGYMYDVEILALAEKLSYRMKEVPIRWRDDGDSRLQLFSGNVQNAIDLLKIRRSVRAGLRMQVPIQEVEFEAARAAKNS